jgi:hypothetical protein
MVCELQIIFGLNPITRELRITRHALVFLEQLGGVAALAIVLAVSRLSAEIWSPLSPTTAPAAALTIIDQMPTSLRVVASPFGIGKQGRYAAKGRYRLLTLSFRSALRKARIERPIASGVGTDFALQLSWWSGPGPAL